MWSYSVALFFAVCLGIVRCETRCCSADVGCFSDDPPFNDLPLPECTEQLTVTMNVFTRSNPSNGQLITRTVIPSVFGGSRLSIFVVHGWMGDDGNTEWRYQLKDAFLQQGDYNVILVAWDAKNPWYPQSASDTRSVGAEIGLVAANLIAQGNSTKSRLHCVGFSLGAHVCGHAGMRTKFGRVSGLDPAGLLFVDRDITAGLNPTSADLVDVIHTDGEPGAGSVMARGHVDFYPNEGRSQPGCRFAEIGCSHYRAVWYYLESITKPCFKSYHKCTDQYHLPESCTSSVFPVQGMGFEANKYGARGIFYLTTNSNSPYCKG